MKTAPQLWDWLADRSARHKTTRRMSAFAARRGDSKLDRHLRPLLAAPVQDATAIVEAVHALFRDDSWVGETIATAAAAIVEAAIFSAISLAPKSHVRSFMSIATRMR